MNNEQKNRDELIAEIHQLRSILNSQKNTLDSEKIQKLFRELLDNAYDAMYLLRGKTYLYVNKAFCKLTGYSYEEVTSPEFSFRKLLSRADREMMEERIAARGRGEKLPNFYELSIKNKQGIEKDIAVNVVPMDHEGDTYILGFVRDITKEKRDTKVQQTLYKISEAVNRTDNLDNLFGMIHVIVGDLLHAENFAIALYDKEKNTIEFPYYVDNAEFPGQLMRMPPKIMRGSITQKVIMSEKPLHATKEELKNMYSEGDAIAYGIQCEHWLGVPLKTIQGVVMGAIIVQTYQESQKYSEKDIDILSFVSTQIAMAILRKQTEDKLRESEMNFRMLTEDAPSIIYIVQDNTFLYMNNTGLQVLQYSPEEIKQLQFHEILHPDFKHLTLEDAERPNENKKASRLEVKVLTKTGTEEWLDLSNMIINYNGEPAVLGNSLIITRRKKAESQHYQSEEKLRNFLNQSSEGIAILNSEGKIVEWNRQMENISGLTSDSVAEVAIWDVMHKLTPLSDRNPATYNKHKMYWESLIHSKSEKQMYKSSEGEFQPINGKKVEFHQIVFCFQSEGKRQFGLLYRDITSEKESQRQINKLSRAVEQSSACIIITNAAGVIEYVNPGFTNSTGYSYDEAIGKTPNFLQSGFTPAETFERLWKKIISGEQWKGEFLNKKKDGSLIWQYSSIAPIKDNDGKITHYIAIQEDMTKRKELEQQLLEAKIKAEESSSFKSNLMANMSHEFRTPMSGILGLASILEEELSEDENLELVEKIILSGKRLMRTLNAILELSQLERRLPEDEQKIRVKVADEVRTIVREYYQDARTKGLRLDLVVNDDSIYAEVIERMLAQIINNLVDNAVKFTHEGNITVTIDSQEQDGRRFATIKVKDTGIGIEPKFYDVIFQEFRQASEGLSRTFEGTGLGLTLSKKMVDVLGGKIFFESEPNVGTEFTVMIPGTYLHEEEVKHDATVQVLAQPNIKTAEKPETPKIEVLLVEDNRINQEITTHFIEDYCNVDAASNAKIALDLAQKKLYSLVLMDINLGTGKNGVQIAGELRTIEGYESVPIIAVTGYALPGDRDWLLSEGCTHYLPKPFSRSELRKIIDKALQK